MDIEEFAFLGFSKHVSGYFGELVDMTKDDDRGNRTKNPFGIAQEDFLHGSQLFAFMTRTETLEKARSDKVCISK